MQLSRRTGGRTTDHTNLFLSVLRGVGEGELETTPLHLREKGVLMTYLSRAGQTPPHIQRGIYLLGIRVINVKIAACYVELDQVSCTRT